MGEILVTNIPKAIEWATKEVSKDGQSQENGKDLFEEIYRVTGKQPDFSQMTDEQYKEWLDKGYEALKDEACKKKETIHLQITDPATGESFKWAFEPTGKNKEHDAINDGDPKGNTLVNGKVTTWQKVKQKLPTIDQIMRFTGKAAYKTADVAAREAQNLTGKAVTKLDRMTDSGAGSFGR